MTGHRFPLLLAAAALCACAPRREDPSTLIGAARAGDIPAIKANLKNGANVNQTGGVNGWTVLQHAIHKGQAASVDALLDAGADPNSSGQRAGLTPLMMAAGYGYEGIVRSLLLHGADPRSTNPHGGTALDLAVNGFPDIDRFTVGKCQPGVVRALLEAAPEMRSGRNLMAKAAALPRGGEGCAELARLLQTAR